VTPADDPGRQIGKFCELAFGFAGGRGAFRNIAPDADFTDQEVEEFKRAWRTAHPMISALWRGLYAALVRAVRTGEPATHRCLGAETRGGNLYLRLPSGRELAYPQARVEPGEFDAQIVYMDNARGAWAEVRGWHGSFVENAVQAIARDLLAGAMMRLEAAGYPIVLHVHDEAVAQVPAGFAGAEEFARLMSEPPDWAAGLPLVAKGWASARYGAKSAAPPAPSPSSSPSSPVAMPAKSSGTAVGSGGIVAIAEPRPAASATVRESASTDADAADAAEPDTLDQRLASIPLADLIGEQPVNGKIRCAFHEDDRPSLHVYSDHYHCFACGAHGNHLDWLREVEGLAPDAAIDTILHWQGRTSAPPRQENDARTLDLALALWQAAQLIAGTLALRYLAEARGIAVETLPPDIETVLRFHPRCPFAAGEQLPCLVARYTDVITDEFAGVHRIALTLDAQKIERRMLGRWPRPRAIKLWPATTVLYLGEGIETVLAAATRLPYRDGSLMRPAWAAGFTGGIAKFPVLPTVRELRLLLDHDSEGEACAVPCRDRWEATGRKVTRLRPPQPGFDFNDVVIKKLQAAS
jgi:hypothetical protein